MRGVDLVIIFLIALFFLVVGIVAGVPVIAEGHIGTGLSIIALGAGGLIAVPIAVLAWLQRDGSGS